MELPGNYCGFCSNLMHEAAFIPPAFMPRIRRMNKPDFSKQRSRAGLYAEA
jgi:hypothetical protein